MVARAKAVVVKVGAEVMTIVVGVAVSRCKWWWRIW